MFFFEQFSEFPDEVSDTFDEESLAGSDDNVDHLLGEGHHDSWDRSALKRRAIRIARKNRKEPKRSSSSRSSRSTDE